MNADDIRIAIPEASCWAATPRYFEVWTRADNWPSARILTETVDVDEISFEVEGLIRHINRVCAAKELGKKQL